MDLKQVFKKLIEIFVTPSQSKQMLTFFKASLILYYYEKYIAQC